MPDEHARKLTDPVPPTAYTPEELVFRWADQLEPKLNAALAEAAMARQETAAQSARIDQLQESTQKSDSRLHGYIGKVEQALEDAISQMPAPKLAVPSPAPVRIKVNFYDASGKLLDWVIPGSVTDSQFYPDRAMLARVYSISVELHRG